MRRSLMAAAVSLSIGAGVALPAPSFGPFAAPGSEQGSGIGQPDLPSIVRGSPRGSARPLPVMFWLADGSASGASRSVPFAQADPLSEGDLRQPQAPPVGAPVPLGDGADAAALLMPTGTVQPFHDPAPRVADPGSGPVLIPLPPAITTGLMTLGGAIVVAVRHRLRKR